MKNRIRQDHPTLVALREAAVVWVSASRAPALDQHDRQFKRIDRRLQQAARKFAAVTTTAHVETSSTSAPRARTTRSSDYDERSRLVASKHLHLVVGFHAVTAWRKRRLGQFPQPIRLSAGRVAWLRSDLEKWLEERQKA